MILYTTTLACLWFFNVVTEAPGESESTGVEATAEMVAAAESLRLDVPGFDIGVTGDGAGGAATGDVVIPGDRLRWHVPDPEADRPWALDAVAKAEQTGNKTLAEQGKRVLERMDTIRRPDQQLHLTLQDALHRVRVLRDEYWANVRVVGKDHDLNKGLEFGLRVADYLEFAEMLIIDALHRRESCGCHLREESQNEDGEPKRDDAHYAYVAAWEFKGLGAQPELHKEPLTFESAEVKQRSYK